MVANNNLNIRGNNANDIVSAEALMMLKEHIAETYGSIRYTIGAGCSGGSIQQYLIAADYPGLLDGIQPNCSFQDSWTTANEVNDCHLLLHYFGTHRGFSAAQQAAVMGDALDRRLHGLGCELRAGRHSVARRRTATCRAPTRRSSTTRRRTRRVFAARAGLPVRDLGLPAAGRLRPQPVRATSASSTASTR